MQDNTCIGPDWMQISQTTCGDARNVSKRHTLPKSHCKLMMYPPNPGNVIAMDHFYHSGRLYLIVCDYFSKFPFLFQTKSTSFANIKDQLEELTMALPSAAKNLTPFFQVLVSNTPPCHQTTPKAMASLRDKSRL